MASVIVVGRRSRQEHRLSGAVTVIGRDAGANLELGDLQLSRRHALLIRARVEVSQNRLREAEADLERAIGQGPRLVDAWFERARVLRQLEVPSRALECLDQAEGLIREGEAYAFSRSLLALERGRIYGDLDDYAAALKHLRRFLEESRAPTSDSEVARARLEADRLIAAFEAKLTGGR